MVAPAAAAPSAPPRVVKWVASLGPLGSTNSVAAAGGKGALQSPIGWQVVLPSFSIVAPVQGALGITSTQPQPPGSGAKPVGQFVHPTGAQVASPIFAIVPAGQSPAGSKGSQPKSAAGRNPSAQGEPSTTSRRSLTSSDFA